MSKQIEFTNDGSLVVYIQEDKDGNPIKISGNEDDLECPIRVRFIKNV